MKLILCQWFSILEINPKLDACSGWLGTWLLGHDASWGVIRDAESFIPAFKSENDGTGGEGLHMKVCQETVSGNIPWWESTPPAIPYKLPLRIFILKKKKKKLIQNWHRQMMAFVGSEIDDSGAYIFWWSLTQRFTIYYKGPLIWKPFVNL